MDTKQIKVIRSRRKTISIEIRPDCSVIVRAPYRMSKVSINQFIQEKQWWIEQHLLKMQERCKRLSAQEKFTIEELQNLADQALTYFPLVVAHYAEMMGITYGKITIRNQRTRWGSCSSKGNLNFNCLLMLLPEEIREYVIIHELCHRREMNHSVGFWAEVEKYCPDYRKLRKRLKEDGESILMRF